MLNYNQTSYGINQAIKTKLSDRDSTKSTAKNWADKYKVKVKDEHGNEYEIKYYF